MRFNVLAPLTGSSTVRTCLVHSNKHPNFIPSQSLQFLATIHPCELFHLQTKGDKVLGEMSPKNVSVCEGADKCFLSRTNKQDS